MTYGFVGVIVRRGSVIVVVLVAIGSACSSGGKIVGPTKADPAEAAQFHAAYACSKALNDRESLVSWSPTTVGAIRTAADRPWSKLFAGNPDRSFAAWCWRRVSTDSYQLFVIGPGKPIFLDVHSHDPVPAGPPPVT
jgi:hypothetical protein